MATYTNEQTDKELKQVQTGIKTDRQAGIKTDRQAADKCKDR